LLPAEVSLLYLTMRSSGAPRQKKLLFYKAQLY
jgi:hypothetical protein